MTDAVDHKDMANAIRALSMDAVEQAKSGHPGMPMGMADVATVLFTRYLKYDPADPHWPDRDRFVLSAGHGSMLLYSLLYLTGYEGMTLDELKRFRQLHSKTPGHPESFMTAGVETTTGPLGQGVATSVGMALAERMLAAEFGEDIVDHHTFVLCSDGDLMEGVSQEAIALAGHLRLNKLIFLFDDNGVSIDGPLTLADSTDQVMRFQAAHWNATRVDGQDPSAVAAAIEAALKSDRPSLIACKTTIGFGAPTKAGTSKAHGEALGAEELAGAKKNARLGFWPVCHPRKYPCRLAQGRRARQAGARRVDEAPFGEGREGSRRVRTPVRAQASAGAGRGLQDAEGKDRGRQADARDPQGERVGAGGDRAGDAGAGHRLGRPDAVEQHPDEAGGGREAGRLFRPLCPLWHPRARHGGGDERHRHAWRPAAGGRHLLRVHRLRSPGDAHRRAVVDPRRLCDDARFDRPWRGRADASAGRAPGGAPRHAQHARLPPGRHDGDGGVLAARAGANRRSDGAGADAAEPRARAHDTRRRTNLCAKGAYEISPASGTPLATIFASGSEVEIAINAQKLLKEKGIAARVVSVPSLELFLAQGDDYRNAMIGIAPVKIAVEAAVRFGWDAVIGPDGLFVGMTSFGASAPYKDVYKNFGITAEAVADAVAKRHNA